MPAPSTTTEFLDLVRKSGLHPPDVLDQVEDLPDEPGKCAAALVKLGLLTPFQAKLLLAGRYRGFRLGPYVIREQIGQGGMGAVYLAEHAQLRKPAAIKVLAPGEGVNRLAVERFLREARSAAALDHPNIVRTYDIGAHKDTHFLVMEYVEGQTLDKLVAQGGPVACGRAVEFITQAAAGLQHAYEKGFIHRDIKPANLILAKDGTVKILDMGLTRSLAADDKLTEQLDQGAVVGTADYISPEQAMNSPGLDVRGDIYSLGATFFTLVTGRPPFEGTTTQKLIQHQMKAPPSLSSIDKTFPPGLSAVVGKMLAKKPEDRYQTPAEVVLALRPWVPTSHPVLTALSRTRLPLAQELHNTLPDVGPGTQRIETEPRPGRKSKAPLIVAGSVVLVAGGIVAAVVALGGLGGDKRTQATTPEPPATQPTEPGRTQPTKDEGKPPPKKDPPTPPVKVAPKPALAYDLNPAGKPTGWQPANVSPNTQGGRPALAAASYTLTSPDLELPSGKAKLMVEYQTTSAREVLVTFKPTKGGTPVSVGFLPIANGKWATQTLELDLNGATAGRIEFGGLVAVAAFTVWDSAPPPDKGLLRLDLSKQQLYVQRAKAAPGAAVPVAIVSETGPGRMPAGWYRWVEFPDAEVEFFADGSPGEMAFGIRNVSGTPGVMTTSPEFNAPPGGTARVRVLYSTGPDSPGFVLRLRPMLPTRAASFDVAKMPPTGGSWRLAVIDFDMKGTTRGLFEFYNVGAGEAAAVRLREVTVLDPK